MATLRNFLGNNSYGIDAEEAEKTMREKHPKLLHEKEHVELAFKSAFDPRDKSYLTNYRILLKDTKGISGKKKNFHSIPYSSIIAFSVETAGSGLDNDVELKVWVSSFTDIKMEFGKGVVDIFAIQQFMNAKVLNATKEKGSQDAVISTATNKGSAKSIVDWLGDNAKECSPHDMEQQLKKEYSILMADETVQLAYQCWRDYTVFTDQRILVVDVQGLTGKKVEFLTVPWHTVRGYSVETAGSFMDRDSELRIFTMIPGLQRIHQDLRKGKGNLWAIQTCLNNHVLGRDEGTLSSVDKKEGHVDPDTSFWGRGNSRPLDAVEMNKTFHTSPPILQTSETVEMAFKGRRDILLFTTKRVIKIDVKGISGKRVEYGSIPWQSIIGFAVETAGSGLDNDSEVKLWTEMMTERQGDETNPYWAMWELDFNKKLVDIIAIKKYLSTRCLNASNALQAVTPLQPNVSNVSTEEKGFQSFLSRVGDDQRAIDPTEMNTILHTELPILLDNELIVMAFKAGRDATFFTNLRVLVLDVQGWSGKKVEYKSLPYTSIRAFSAESAGSWDRDSEVKLYTRNLWNMARVGLDFRKGKADIVMIQKFLAAILLGTKEDAEKYFQSAGGVFSDGKIQVPGADSFVSWLTSNSVEMNAEAISHQLHSEPPILLDGEHVEKAYRGGRDMYVYTNLRFLKVDVQGMSGKKVEYVSLPMQYVMNFEVETAGSLDPDAEVYLRASVTHLNRVEQDILVKHGDVMDMNLYLTHRLLENRLKAI